MSREDYSAIQAGKIARLKERADKAATASVEAFEASYRTVSHIPFGQPILIGHHSEKKHRGTIKRSQAQLEKGIELSKKAEELKSRAASAEINPPISSDDPDALETLKEKVAKLEELQERMKAVNKIIAMKPKNETSPGKIEMLLALGFSESFILKAFQPDFCGRLGFASYLLTNNNAKIKATKLRIAQLEKVATLKAERVEYPGFALVINTELNRVQIDFDSKEAYNSLCKEKGISFRVYGFVFSQRDGNVWQRKITGDAISKAKQVAKLLTA